MAPVSASISPRKSWKITTVRSRSTARRMWERSLPSGFRFSITSASPRRAGACSLTCQAVPFGFPERVSDAYRVAPIFLIRMAGAPFETVEQLSTRATSGAARELLVRQRNFADAKETAEKLFAHRINELSDDAFKMWRTAIRQGRVPPEPGTSHPAEFKRYVDELVALNSAGANLEACLAREVGEARTRLVADVAGNPAWLSCFWIRGSAKSLLRRDFEHCGNTSSA